MATTHRPRSPAAEALRRLGAGLIGLAGALQILVLLVVAALVLGLALAYLAVHHLCAGCAPVRAAPPRR